MSRLNIVTQSTAQTVVEGLYRDLERRIVASPPGLCPVDMAASFLKLCHAQTCGKCVPCRVGLGQLGNLLEDVLNGDATLETIDLIEKTARAITNSADCAIGYEAADMVLRGVIGFRDDYEEHILHGRCTCSLNQPVPCVALCPAGVDIPGYIALVSEGRYADAVRLIRKVEGEDARGVISAVEMLREIGSDRLPDFTGKNVVVIGGGNVAMDVTRSAVRLGAKKVSVAYRRRKVDMTALPDEVEGAIAEGCEILDLQSPRRIEVDEDGNAVALWVKPQIIGKIDSAGRPKPTDSQEEEKRIPADLVIVAIGQGIESRHFQEAGVPVKRGVIEALSWSGIENTPGVFAGGDCVTGPATVIRAIAAGKVAAANIDTYLGYNHVIKSDVEIPAARLDDRPACGRINMTERDANERKNDFELIECGMTCEEANQESRRCLRSKPLLFKGHQRDWRLPCLCSRTGRKRKTNPCLQQFSGRRHGNLYQ